MNIYFDKYLKHRPSTSTHLYIFLYLNKYIEDNTHHFECFFNSLID